MHDKGLVFLRMFGALYKLTFSITKHFLTNEVHFSFLALDKPVKPVAKNCVLHPIDSVAIKKHGNTSVAQIKQW